LAGLGGRPIQIAVTLIALAGSIPLVFYHRTYRRKSRSSVTNLQMRAILIAGLIVSIFLAGSMIFSQNRPVGDALFDAPLTAFSAQTTAGFSSFDISALNPESKLILIVTSNLSSGTTAQPGVKISIALSRPAGYRYTV
jgi:trk system potassium uptake protein